MPKMSNEERKEWLAVIEFQTQCIKLFNTELSICKGLNDIEKSLIDKIDKVLANEFTERSMENEK